MMITATTSVTFTVKWLVNLRPVTGKQNSSKVAELGNAENAAIGLLLLLLPLLLTAGAVLLAMALGSNQTAPGPAVGEALEAF